jgi:hypothetical protein
LPRCPSHRQQSAGAPLSQRVYNCVFGYGVTGKGGAVGRAFVEVGIDEVSGSGGGAVVAGGVVGLLVEVGATACDIDWVAASGVAGGAVVVSGCWLHPYSARPARALVAAIWNFRNDFIFYTFFRLLFTN